jgi:hypothetical protein
VVLVGRPEVVETVKVVAVAAGVLVAGVVLLIVVGVVM